jgi:hypothetical protein
VSFQSSGVVATALLHAMWAQLSAQSAQQQKYDLDRLAQYKTGEEAAEGSGAAVKAGGTKAPVLLPPARWQAALLACVPELKRVQDAGVARSVVRRSAVVSYLCLLSAHPLVSGSLKKAAQVWQSVCAKILALFGLSSTIDFAEEEEGSAAEIAVTAAMKEIAITDADLEASRIVPALVQALTEASVSEVQNTRAAAQQALYLLSDPSQLLYADKRSIDCVLPQFDASILTEHVLPAVLSLLDLTAVNALTEADLLAYTDPNGAIAATLAHLQQQSDAARAAESVITNADRKKTAPRSARRGNFGADSTVLEDQDWAERVRAEKAQAEQKARSEGGAEYEEVKKSVHAQRVDVAKKIDRVLRAISLWQALTAVNVSTARAGLTMLLDSGKLAALLRSDVVGEAAHKCLVQLVHHVIEPDCASYER